MPAFREHGGARFRAVAPAVLPAAFLLGGWIWWASADGGFFIADWAPLGILFVALAFVVVAGTGRALPEARVARVALLCLAGFVSWTFLSIAWSVSQGAAWDAAAKLVPILASCWILSLLPWTSRGATIFAGVWAVGIAVVCFIALLEARGAADLGGLRTVGRLTVPMGYTNAAGSLAWLAFSPALLISYRKSLSPAIQGVGLGAAVLLLEYGLLPQSRGALLAIGVSILVLVAAAPDRLRLLVRLVAAGALLAAASGPILDVQQAADVRSGVQAALDDAIRAIAITSGIAVVAGVLIGFAERAGARREGVARAARRVGLGLVGLGCAALVVVALVNAGSAVDDVGGRWADLTDEHSSPDGRSSRFGNLDPEGRTDAWRVAVDLFQERPVAGIGAGNYAREYTMRREVERHSRFVHDIWLRALAEGGLVAALLLIAAIGTAAGACVAALWRQDPEGRAVLATCLAVTAMFFGHASLDWLEEFPALAMPGFGFMFIGACLRAPGATPPAPGRLGVPAFAAAAVVALLAVVAILSPFLANRWSDRAFETFRAQPAEAYDDLERARAADPLDPDNWSSEGTIALTLGDTPRAVNAFRRSIEVEDNWYARLELAVIEASEGRFAAAARDVRVATRLNPVDPSVAAARRLIRNSQRIDAVRFNQRLVRRAQSYFTRTQG